MVKSAGVRGGGPAQPHTTHAEDPGSQLFETPSFGCQATTPPSVTEVSSLRGGRHLAVQRGGPVGKELLGTQRESATECTREALHLHSGGLVEKTPVSWRAGLLQKTSFGEKSPKR